MLANPDLTNPVEFHQGLDEDEMRRWRLMPAAQQPAWDGWLLGRTRALLAGASSLVRWRDVTTLRTQLAEVALGRRQVVQAGDCAEDPAECTPQALAPKAALVDDLARVMRVHTGLPVVQVGRLAGQFAKPRSHPHEFHAGVQLPVFRGHLVNSPQPDSLLRRADPLRLVTCYQAAARAMSFLAERNSGWQAELSGPLWTSHEALVLDYELPLLRRAADGRILLTSTHWPWIGDRTRQLDGAHVRLLATVSNPVACKVGPTMDVADLLALCRVLDPDREPGRLTFIVRLGADLVSDRLAPLVAAVRAAGHPVIWMCDPMHGNTMTTAQGQKTRYVDTVTSELRRFRAIVENEGAPPGGLHLETTPDHVMECVPNESEVGRIGAAGTDDYRSFCDPRLNPGQAVEAVMAWCAAPIHSTGTRP
jgi:3-deoxy-7-phosphoheptulonate synthase